jgi:NTE family protein
VEWIDEADGVFRGGGVKGLGLAGALLGFAEHPDKPVTKWVNVAGASAGAIIACYLACGHDAADIAGLMKKTRFADFQDFPPPGKLVGGGNNLLRRHGLARGEAFRLWFGEQLEHKTFAATKTADGTGYRLKLIAVDVTNRALLVLPDDLPRYRRAGDDKAIDPDTFEVADAARMSMSIPYFFEPFQLVRDRVLVEDPGDNDQFVANAMVDRIDVERENAAMNALGNKETAFRELTARELKTQRAVIIDGGTLSNFPVWLFDVANPGQPLRRPTFGFTLTGGKGVGGAANAVVARMPWALRFGVDIFHTSQEAWDARFVSHSTRVRTVTVNAGTVGTTDFNLTAGAQDMLIENGRTAAKRFLDKFDLADYQNTYHRTFGDAAAAAVATPEPVLVGGAS